MKNSFPKKIKSFRFYKLFPVKDSSYKFAIYKDDDGKEYMCKLWEGNRKNLKNKWINNEIDSYKLFSKIKIVQKSQKKFLNINIPNIYYSYKSESKVFFVMDKVRGISMISKSSREIVNAYEIIYSYLIYASKFITPGNNVTKRNYIHYIILLHLYLISSVIKYPSHVMLFIKTLPTAYRGLFLLRKDKEHIIVLRDLSSDANIFIDKNKISIIDLEHVTLSHKIVQVASFVLAEIPNKRVIKSFLSSNLFKKIKENRNNLSSFKAFLIYGAFVEITASYRADKQKVKKESIEIIKIALSL